uniref:Uncharacterized protein n=1 Tax=Arundo donax TaxID=35708 RepID=A0A0A9G019_ARUDO
MQNHTRGNGRFLRDSWKISMRRPPHTTIGLSVHIGAENGLRKNILELRLLVVG